MDYSFEQTWIPFTQGCFVPCWVEIGQVVLEKIFKFRQCISLYHNYVPLEKGGALNKLESPLPKDALCQVWLKLAQWFWRKRLWNFVNVFSLFRNNLPIEKSATLHFKTCIPFTLRCFVPSLVEIGPVVLKKIFKFCQCIFAIS